MDSYAHIAPSPLGHHAHLLRPESFKENNKDLSSTYNKMSPTNFLIERSGGFQQNNVRNIAHTLWTHQSIISLLLTKLNNNCFQFHPKSMNGIEYQITQYSEALAQRKQCATTKIDVNNR